MGRSIRAAVLGMVLVLAAGSARAQAPAAAGSAASAPATPYRMNGYLAAPGLYGMSYGSPSYGVPRTYTAFNSPMSPGYGFGYAPYGLLPGRYGVGLWRSGFVAPGYVYGASSYQTFAAPGAPGPLPPVGIYAPGFGAPSYYGW